MHLKAKIILILLSLFLAFVAVQLTVQKFIIYPDFETLERNFATTDIERVTEAVYARLDYLDRLNNDWASWDDTVQFINDRNQEYFQSNLVKETQYNALLNAMVFFDTNHKLVWGRILDLDNMEELAIKSFESRFTKLILPKVPVYNNENVHTGESVKGLLIIDNIPVLVSARSVLSSGNHGPTKGVLIFAQFLSPTAIQEIKEDTKIDFKISLLTATKHKELPSSRYQINHENPTELSINSTLRDITDQPALVIEAIFPREITQKGATSINYAMTSTFILSLLILGVVLFAIQRVILRPVTLLQQVVKARQTGNRVDRTGYTSSDELGQLASTFDRMIEEIDIAEQEIKDQRDELIEVNKQRNKFFSIISHDLKSPFNTLMGFSELLIQNIDKLDKRKIAEYSQDIHDSAKRAFNLLEDLLEWSLIQIGQTSLDIKPLDLTKILSDNIALSVPMAENKSLSFIYELTDTLAVLSDRHVVNTVIRNLLNNAIKFTPKGGNITIKTHHDTKAVTISVSDTGVGMSQEKISQLFNFEKKSSTPGTEGEVGTGLGLRVCQELLDKQGSTLIIDSEPGKGSTFSFKLPLTTI